MDTFSYSFDEEIFQGKYASREEARSAAVAGSDGLDAGTSFWTGKNMDPPHASTFMQDADDVVDDMARRAYDEFDESADGWPGDYTPEQRNEIQRRLDDLADYIQSIDPPKFYVIGEVEQHAVPEA